MTSRALLMRVAVRGERLVYRVAGLPVALRMLFKRRSPVPADVIRSAFALAYWQPGWDNAADIAAAVILSPIVLLGGAAWFTIRNGSAIRRRDHKALARQFIEQLHYYFTDGVLSPWYYIFRLHEDSGHPETYLQRFETKTGIYPLLRRGVRTELNDKKIFADYCVEMGVPCVPYLFHLTPGGSIGGLPDCDLFVKPAGGRGGRGAERWDCDSPGQFSGSDGRQLDSAQLSDYLKARAKHYPILVQRRVETHPDLADLTSGALPTVRITTCLNERGDPEIVGAVFRMAIGENRTVDNLHAGGIAAGVDSPSGQLSSASNLGMDAKLGWLDRHPDTGAQITGRRLPLWRETATLAIAAHRSFADRVLVGWDIAITERGPIVVEGNSSPDLDILQRFGPPVCTSRLGDLLAWHLLDRGFASGRKPTPVIPAKAA
jgi:hypothetical protein